MEFFCTLWDLNSVPSAYEANALISALQEVISIKHLNVDHVSPEFTIKIMFLAPGICSKIFCRVFLSYDICLTN